MINRFYKQKIIIQRKTLTNDGGGSFKEVWKKLKEVKGLIVMSNGSERMLDQKRTVISSHTLFCNKTDLKSTDRVECEGNIYEVILPEDPLSLSHHMEVELQLIK
ncbi:MAG: head-tail adaptor protein [Melioribacter sp.]|nr:head-tail adaptor protein [Melioribacter sp.]